MSAHPGTPTGLNPDLVFFDGGCGLCQGAVRFLLARDADGHRFRFAPLQGETARARLDPAEAGCDSMVVLPAGGPPLRKSRAAVRLLRRLGGGWMLVAGVLALVPPRLRDWGYDRVAANRSRRTVQPGCPVPPAGLPGERFLP